MTTTESDGDAKGGHAVFDASSAAVSLIDVSQSYRTFFKRKETPVLRGITLTVPRGTIYGLLGPSGTGKTTLLKCLVGRVKVDGGIVTLFGHKPGTKESGVPHGNVVGYMPQDVALTSELTVVETLSFFGRVAGMSSSQIKANTKFLMKLLIMDKYKNKTIGQLSGGQKRRASFAVALVHQPKLLILDEPTVGVDPVLRQSIWNHLMDLVNQTDTTVLITTHYIEEARMAHNVGLLLNGKLLAEAPPEKLIESYSCATLEEVFLKLCVQTDSEEAENSEQQTPLVAVNCGKVKEFGVEKKENPVANGKKRSMSFRLSTSRSIDRLMAMIIKMLLFYMRNPVSIVLEVIVPPLLVLTFAAAIGKPLFGLEVAVVNKDDVDLGIGELYLSTIDSHTIHLKYFDEYEEAMDVVKQGKAWAVIYLNANFSNAIMRRLSYSIFAEPDVVKSGVIQVDIDSSNNQAAVMIYGELLRAMETFSEKMLTRLGFSPELSGLPIKVNFLYEVDGVLAFQFDNFLCPGIVIGVVFFLSMGATAINQANEKQLGCTDRLVVSGITAFDFIFSYLVTHIMVFLVELTLIFAVVFGLFSFVCRGSKALAIFLTFLQGICGLSSGLLVSTVTDDVSAAVVMSMGTFFVSIIIQGIIWPLEGMSYALRYVSYGLPSTFAVDGMRSIMARGWDLTYTNVILGFTVSVTWIAFLISAAWLVYRFRL
ncbi:hypothetical protein CHUAL_006323 [Chamberlinius hualienensis]